MWIDIFRNDISDLRSISSLQFLDLRNNRIREMAQLNVISGNKELTTLLLDGNEICKIRDYHILVFDTIPSLKVVDIWYDDEFVTAIASLFIFD